MSTVDFEGVLELVRPSCVGAAGPILDRLVVSAAKDFCRRTRWWHRVARFAAIVEDEAFYQIDLDSHEAVYALEEVLVNDSPIYPRMTATSRADVTGGVYSYEMQPNGVIKLYDIPMAQTTQPTLSALVTLWPSKDAVALDEDLSGRWAEAIAEKVLYHALILPKQPFTDANLAMAHGRRYDQLVRSARNQHDRNMQIGRAGWGGVTSSGNLWR